MDDGCLAFWIARGGRAPLGVTFDSLPRLLHWPGRGLKLPVWLMRWRTLAEGKAVSV